MQDLTNAQFKRDNVLLWPSSSKIPSETKESESQYSVANVGGQLKSIETEWALWFFILFFFIFKE